MRVNPSVWKLVRWLEDHPGIAAWSQAAGVVVALAFGIVQVRQAREALEASALSNQINLRANASDLLVGINEAALAHPEIAGGFAGVRRLHLMRLHYFYRAHQLSQAGILDADAFEAETNYLGWCASLDGFPSVWEAVRSQYRTDFQRWVDSVLETIRLAGETREE